MRFKKKTEYDCFYYGKKEDTKSIIEEIQKVDGGLYSYAVDSDKFVIRDLREGFTMGYTYPGYWIVLDARKRVGFYNNRNFYEVFEEAEL